MSFFFYFFPFSSTRHQPTASSYPCSDEDMDMDTTCRPTQHLHCQRHTVLSHHCTALIHPSPSPMGASRMCWLHALLTTAPESMPLSEFDEQGSSPPAVFFPAHLSISRLSVLIPLLAIMRIRSWFLPIIMSTAMFHASHDFLSSSSDLPFLPSHPTLLHHSTPKEPT